MFVVIGETPAARRVCASLDEREPAIHLVAPTDAELTQVFRAPVRAAAVLVREDVHALRYALALAHLDPTVRLVVTVFDRTMADQLRSFLSQAVVFSPADLSAPGIAAVALGPDLVWTRREGDRVLTVHRHADGSLEETSTPPARTRLRSRTASALRWNHRQQDAGTRLMILGLLGLAAVLVVDWAWLMLLQGHHADAAFLEAARVVATVGPGPTAGGPGYAIWSGTAMLATIGFTAMFTAGLVDRLFAPRLLTMVGSRTAPRRGHVIVVGMGQLGVRVSALLTSLGVPVVGVERDPGARWLPLARRLRIPVVVGEGTERRVLEDLRLGRSASLVAVGSDDLDNISVAVAAAAVAPGTRVVLRAGEQEAIAETRSLMPLGAIRDVTELTAAFVVSRLHGQEVDGVFSVDGAVHVRTGPGLFRLANVSGRNGCPHPAIAVAAVGAG